LRRDALAGPDCPKSKTKKKTGMVASVIQSGKVSGFRCRVMGAKFSVRSLEFEFTHT
jgi:hypothetical protein